MPAIEPVDVGCLVNPTEVELLNRQYDRRPPAVIVCAADVPGRRRGEIISMHPYHDVDGSPLYEAVTFRAWSRRAYRRPVGAGDWTWGLKGVRRVLYRLPQLAAADAAAWVFIVPYERDADAVAALGLVATCCPGGPGEWSRGGGLSWERKWLLDWSVLAGRRVVIVIPNSGNVIAWVHVDDLAARLAGKAAEIRILALPGNAKSVAAWVRAETAAETKTKGRRTHVHSAI